MAAILELGGREAILAMLVEFETFFVVVKYAIPSLTFGTTNFNIIIRQSFHTILRQLKTPRFIMQQPKIVFAGRAPENMFLTGVAADAIFGRWKTERSIMEQDESFLTLIAKIFGAFFVEDSFCAIFR